MTTTLRTPADIVAAAAGLLGFVPTNSIVAYMLRADTEDNLIIRCAIRCDITITTAQAARFPTTCNLHPTDNDATILLAVCDDQHHLHALAVLDALRDAFTDNGIPVQKRILTGDVTAEGQWYDPDTGQHGPTYPYTDSLITTQRVLNGQHVGAARADLEAEFSALPPAPAVPLTDHRALVHTTAAEIGNALHGAPIDRTLPTRAGHIITADVAVRDAMIWAAAEHPHDAAPLWTHIARRLRGRPRGEALTIAAIAHCMHGDTIRAGIAVDIALDEADAAHTPAPRLAVLLCAALRAGLPPDQIRTAIPPSAPPPASD